MGRHVLLIEDEPNITEAMRFILARDGWTVSSHADGATAVNAVSRAKPDVVVLDVMLPGKSGYDILRELRANPDTEGLPIMMLTARGQVKDRERAESFGVSHFMTKPFSNREVLDTLNSLLDP